ncbi:MAG: hypothetical protein HZA37_01320 [Parcubacteria group bacterium]|nr:hypothetical protein [Parcubacteria group bacterium]
MPVTAWDVMTARFVLADWRISERNQNVILGYGSTEIRNASRHWSVVPDMEERLSCIRAINIVRSELFGDKRLGIEMFVLWLRTSRDEFGGQNALEVLCGGELENLKFVYDRLADDMLERYGRSGRGLDF